MLVWFGDVQLRVYACTSGPMDLAQLEEEEEGWRGKEKEGGHARGACASP